MPEGGAATAPAAPAVAGELVSQLSAADREAAQRLAALLSVRELRHLLGRKVIEAYRNVATHALGRAPSLSGENLAAALLLRDGAELFADVELRRAVARRLRIDCPGRWHPGKSAAVRFVRDAGFDLRFAGTPASRPPEDVEYLSGRPELPPLADFQQQVLTDIREALHPRRRWPRVVLSLPTGAGKTRVATEFVRERIAVRGDAGPAVVLWLAHTAELLEQAVESLRQVWQAVSGVPPIRVDRRFGQHGRSDESDQELLGAPRSGHQFVVATPQRLLNDLARWQRTEPALLADWLDALELVVIDEAHRAAAPQYQRVLDAITDRWQPQVLGLTATPFRYEYHHRYPELGTRELYKLFRRIVTPERTLGEHPREALQARGVLAVPREHHVDTGTRIRIGDLFAQHDDSVDEAAWQEKVDRRLMELADDAIRRRQVFGHLRRVCADVANRVLYFGPSVADAEIMTFLLRGLGIPAGFVSGESRPAQRRATIEAFRRGSLRVLCNCEVLTTGFDAPQVTHVVIARPTVSHVLFEQMVGRGLRGPRFGGTAVCDVLYFVDDIGADAPRLGFRAWRAIWGLDAPE